MKFFDRLQKETQQSRDYLFTAPIIHRAMSGDFTLEDYAAFLLQAYHHVKHTTPLLMATGSHIDGSREWLRDAVAEYIEEELGHQEWILNDITACGFNKEKARNSKPNMSTELMVAYTYDSINRVSPLTFFGLVQVLEGTSIQIADQAAQKIQHHLALPQKAFSYLHSHGQLDQEHIKFFEKLMDKIEDEQEQQQIIHAAQRFYHLYGDILRELSPEQAKTIA
ncbi:TenA family transcriptional regulator [Shewanella surugensis]|uniref:Iron-containing redox enzyme family protein n=1 Tax=Shewanella surugensis TaxID=212020 RepID=A0ABT0L9P1_9GAMM|nr:iron-containing redox enzyme family protein [Shewanella surugensis]MCL1124355.1 iron-containing redox enzyme family protein [Shewanella surugensis]